MPDTTDQLNCLSEHNSEVLGTVKPAMSGMFIQRCGSGKVQGKMFSNYEGLWEDGRLEAVFEENKKNEWAGGYTKLNSRNPSQTPVSTHERAWTIINPVIATDIGESTDHQSHTQLITC